MWKAVFMAFFRNCSISHLDTWRKREIFSQKGLFPSQDSNWTPLKYKTEMLPLKTSCMISVHIAVTHDLVNFMFMKIYVTQIRVHW
jgi:hypothetical protein